jgi:hypothetical protein
MLMLFVGRARRPRGRRRIVPGALAEGRASSTRSV